jgi:hypothetical protein
MNRRAFLGALGAAIAGATLDPERLLWVPGRKRIFIPAPQPAVFLPPFFVAIVPRGQYRFSIWQNPESWGDLVYRGAGSE